jgi:ubiquinone/menaquinone biosynthesis C-methylase UbiE
MNIIDKKNIVPDLLSLDCVTIELGCANSKLNSKSIGIDIIDFDDVDLVGDVYEILELFPNSSVDKVLAYHFMEHVIDVELLLKYLNRILKDNGVIEFVVPHFSNPFYYSDPTHKTFFGLYTFQYFLDSKSIFNRKVPNYNSSLKLEVKKVDLIFKSVRPHYFRHFIKKIIEKIFNLNIWTKEFYEENLCYLFPCYEVRYIISKPQ